MRPAAPILAILAAAMILPAAAKDEPPPEPGVTVQQLGSARQLQAVLPGRLLGYALPARPGGGRDVLLLVAPEPQEAGPDPVDQESGRANPGRNEPGGAEGAEPAGTPRLLLRLETAGTAKLAPVARELPPGASSIDAADLDGDGLDELLLFEPGHAWVIRRGGEEGDPIRLESLLDDPRVTSGRFDPALIRSSGLEDAARLSVPLMGALLIYDTVSGGRWRVASEVELPLDASLREGVLRITSPYLRPLGATPEGNPLYASGPRPAAGRRLHTLLIDPLAADPGERIRPVWSRLPEPELVMESFFLLMDGRPVLLVTTRSAEKLSFFAEKRIRIFPLEPGDRSRAGDEPLESFESGANLWQSLLPFARDVNGDGRDDIILAYWKGLKDDTLVLDAHLRRPGGKPPRGPTTTRFDVEDGDRSLLAYGRDLDGDGLPDLLLRTERGQTRIHRGLRPGRKGKDLVEPEPRWSFPTRGVSWEAPVPRAPAAGSGGPDELFESLTGQLGPARLADLDGDGDLELLAVRRSSKGRGRFWVTDLDR